MLPPVAVLLPPALVPPDDVMVLPPSELVQAPRHPQTPAIIMVAERVSTIVRRMSPPGELD
jgi:hypothetical protein